jgi:protein-S-isoprenylcysteine O-methyltransferase Ste14
LKARILVGLQFTLLGLLFLKPAGALLSDAKYLRGIAAFLTLCAIAIFIAAYVALKPSLRISPIPKPGAALITTGIYRWFRHPMYVAVLLLGAGLLLDNFNLASTIMWIILLFNMIIKARYEDELLLIRHPEAKIYQISTVGLLGRRNA